MALPTVYKDLRMAHGVALIELQVYGYVTKEKNKIVDPA
jgi:hypothetical protein